MSSNSLLCVFGNDDFSLPINERLKKGAERASLVIGQLQKDDQFTPRPHQEDVFRNLVSFLLDNTENESTDNLSAYGRIIQPSRTGKTVIAGRFICESGLVSTFIVPTKILLEQAVKSLREQLGDANSVGYYYSEEQRLVTRGVNVITYSSLINIWKSDGCLPEPLAKSALVFVDEGHMAMTSRRLTVLQNGFLKGALRIAMTATPDYDHVRELGRYFPTMIHELTLVEAMDLDLLAPFRLWVDEVCVDASKVKMGSGISNDEELGSLMSAAPFFKTALSIRYSKLERERGVLICCASRQQAWDLCQFFSKFKPRGSSDPVVIDKDTNKDDRKKIIDGFENGTIDTIINVRTMLTGWDSKRCKTLIDLFPSTSHVLSMQKYSRPLTRDEETEAHLYLLIPTNLPHIPVLPTDFFCFGQGTYEVGTIIASRVRQRSEVAMPPVVRDQSPIESVTAKNRIILSHRFEVPKLDPKNLDEIKAVIMSVMPVSSTQVCGYVKFRWLYFNHVLFHGHGWQLLRYLNVEPNKFAYYAFMVKLFGDDATDAYLRIMLSDKTKELTMLNVDCAFDARHVIDFACSNPVGERHIKALKETARACWGAEIPSPEDIVLHSELCDELNITFLDLDVRAAAILREYFGIGDDEMSLREVGIDHGVSVETIRKIILKTLRSLRHPQIAKFLKCFVE